MSDIVAVMADGRVVQTGTPSELYLHPADSWVGSFLGDADFLNGRAEGGRVATPAGTFDSRHQGDVTVMIRPEAVTLHPAEDGTAVVRRREFFGHDQLVTVGLADGSTLRARLGPSPLFQLGDRVEISVHEAATFPRSGPH